MDTVLYITTEPQECIEAETAHNLAGKTVRFLDLSNSGIETELPEGWERLRAGDFFDPDAFRRDFINFLEEWPKKPIWKGKSFDDLFRRRDGYSVWWTSVGAERTPKHTPVPELRTLWILDRAIHKTNPGRVVFFCRSSDLASAVVSRCKVGEITVESARGSAEPSPQSDSAGLKWLLSQLGKLATRPIKVVVLATLVRLVAPATRESRKERRKPAILIGINIDREMQVQGDNQSVPFWDSLLEELRRRNPNVRQRKMLNPVLDGNSRWELIRWLRRTGRRLQHSFPGAAPRVERHTGLGAWFAMLPRQCVALATLALLERRTDYLNSFVFASADVTAIIAPRVRQAVTFMAEWERRVARQTKFFQWIGNIQVILVRAEFYGGLMAGIAAAKRLGALVIGVQHGTIMPMHLVYTVPRGHVERAPIPDNFAAYGEYAKEIVSVLGAYPTDRVWITGSPRMDHLVKNPPDRDAARRRLGLPTDKRIVLVATQTFRWFPRAIEAVFEATKQRSDCLVCIKTHFGDRGRMDDYRATAETIGGTSVRFYDNQFDDLLAACDVLISASSTTVLEACLLNRPTICINFSDEPDRYPYVADGASLPARTSQELRDSLDALSNGFLPNLAQRQRDFLRHHAGPTSEGRGTSVLVDRLSEFLSPVSNTDVVARSFNAMPSQASTQLGTSQPLPQAIGNVHKTRS